MRYVATINVWDAGVNAALVNGQMRLQRGQWVKCGANAKASRWVGRSSAGSLGAVHPDGTGRVSMERFKSACENWSGYRV